MSDILKSLCGELHDLLHRPAKGVTIRELELQVEPYRPPGLWAFTRPGLGRPLLWRFPQPLHPLEALAAATGFGGEEQRDDIIALANHRAESWVDYTARVAVWIGLTPHETRLAWTLLTPLNIPNGGSPDGYEAQATALWNACGVPGESPWTWAATAYTRRGLRGLGRRDKFWTDECYPDTKL